MQVCSGLTFDLWFWFVVVGFCSDGGEAIHNIEITLGKDGQLARAAGAVAKLIAKEGKSATLKLPSREVRLISKNCSATVGQVGNVGVNQKSLGRAGSKCQGKRPVVRGVVMNPE